ncbi:MAG: glycosyltransferase family 4 protein [Chryseolinea sp.]
MKTSALLYEVKVLILHQHFKTPESGGALRSYYLAKALADNGFQPVVITGGDDPQAKKVTLENIEINYLPIPYDNGFGFWKRVRSFLHFTWQSVQLARTIDGVAMCYAISVPLTTGISAWWLKRTRGTPYLFEVGDLWPDAPIALGYIRNYFLKKLLFGLERLIYREAKAVIALSTSIQSAIKEKVPDVAVRVIPNMADTDFFGLIPENTKVLRANVFENKFVVSYIGAVGVANGLDYFIECARACYQQGWNVHFVICGDGALLNRHKNSVSRLNLSNFTFLPFTNRNGVRDLLNITDAAFVCYKPYEILETGSPNKYFDGLAAGKLILINFEGWIKKEIELQGCGVYINRQQPNDFVKVIKPFLKDKLLLEKYQRAARELAVARYSRKALSKEFVSLFTEFR